MGTMSVRSKTLWLTLEIANGDIYFFDRKRLEQKKLNYFSLHRHFYADTQLDHIDFVFSVFNNGTTSILHWSPVERGGLLYIGHITTCRGIGY